MDELTTKKLSLNAGKIKIFLFLEPIVTVIIITTVIVIIMIIIIIIITIIIIIIIIIIIHLFTVDIKFTRQYS